MQYLKLLDYEYKNAQGSYDCPPENKLQFAGSFIFDFTTDDSYLDEIFAKKMIEVLESIVGQTQFEYQAKSEDHYLNFIMMCNSKFLHEKVTYGTSIRGCFLDESYRYEVFCGAIIEKGTLTEFIKDVIDWVKLD